MEKDTWSEYGKLVLKELERLNDNHEKMREDFGARFTEINDVLRDLKNTEKTVYEQKIWIDKVNDVWSPTQMKEAKDEIYRQKNKWIAAIAVITFIQIIIGIIIAVKRVH